MVAARRRRRHGDWRHAQLLGAPLKTFAADRSPSQATGCSAFAGGGTRAHRLVADTAVTEMPSAQDSPASRIEAAASRGALGDEPRLALFVLELR